MKVIKINKTQREEWNHFATENPYGSFLQSYEWSLFQKSLDRRVFRLAIPNVVQALIIKYDLPFGKSYLYSPCGPIIDPELSLSDSINIFKVLSQKVKEIAQKENAIFWRMDPTMPDSAEERTIFKELGLQKLSREIQPKITLILDLAKSEKEILSQMHPKTRYNIRLAERKGVTVRIFNFPACRLPAGKAGQARQFSIFNSIDVFWEMLRRTAKRDGFRIYPREYYQKMLETFPPAKLFLAEYKGKIIAADIVVFFGKRATYIHGASDYEFRNLMAPHLLKWHQILEAKNKGFKVYDFWGIDKKKWPGLTRFKKGFGGKEINYIGAWDLIYQPVWHRIYNLARKAA